MNSQIAFKMAYSLNLHFSSLNYSVLRYGANSKASQTKWDTMTSNQRNRFEWLATKYPHTQDLVYACLGSQFSNVSVQFGQREEIVEAFFKFKSRRESISHVLKSDFIKHELIDFEPVEKLIFKYFVKEYSPEYIIMLTNNTEKLMQLYESPNLSWAKPDILKLIKYKPFFNTEKYQNLTKQHEYDVN